MAELQSISKLCWMRDIQIKLTSQKFPKLKPLVYGANDGNNLTISVNGVKKLSALQDSGTVAISNLTYAEIGRIVMGEYYQIEIFAGYKSQGEPQCYFKGYVAYISDKLQARRDNTCYILFASELVAKWSQKRINFNTNSSINVYAAMNYLTKTLGISQAHLSDDLKYVYLGEVESSYNTPANIVEAVSNNSGTLTVNSDQSLAGNGLFNFTNLEGKRYIEINPNTINFQGGNPTLDKNGLKLTLLPTFNFMTGDIIKIDNGILDISESDLSGAQSNFKSNYIDSNGFYVIMQIDYHFENRGNKFQLDIIARALDFIKNITG